MGRLLFSLFLLFSTQPASALEFRIYDFDNVVVESRELFGGTFATKFVLYRVEHRALAMQKIPEGPYEVEVTPIEFHRIKNLLAKGQGYPGQLSRKVHLSSGISIYAGDYMFVEPMSLKYYMESQEPGRNYPLEDLKAAVAKGEGYKGRLWPAVKETLSTPEGAKKFVMLTSRAHSVDEWMAFFEYLVAIGETKHVPDRRNIHNVGRAEYEVFGKTTDVKKTNFIRQFVLNLKRVPLQESDMRWDMDGEKIKRQHSVMIAEDMAENLELTARELQKIQRGRHSEVKVILVNAGYGKDISDSGRPEYAVMLSDGSYRNVHENEYADELSYLRISSVKAKAKGKTVMSCRGMHL